MRHDKQPNVQFTYSQLVQLLLAIMITVSS